MIFIFINGVKFLVKKNVSILECCKLLGYTIPRFCYHSSLSVAGNCRMCLIELTGSEKPVVSCLTEIDAFMKIWLNTPLVKKARENVVETLLINHPLDCPICDQAGECDLQDQSKIFGIDRSRHFFSKTPSEDKYCGPLIKTIMTRCIHCTRCVRFCDEIAGISYFGTLNRGGSTEIGTYLEKVFISEISSNVVDLCPVGALTFKTQAFKERPWELKILNSIDTTDSLGSAININFKETEILRIFPKNTKHLNENFISDKARFFFDSIHINRAVSSCIVEDKNKKTDVVFYSYFHKKIEKYSLFKFRLNIDLKKKRPSFSVLKQSTNLFSDYKSARDLFTYYNSRKTLVLLDESVGNKTLNFLLNVYFFKKNKFVLKKVSNFLEDNIYIQNSNGFIDKINQTCHYNLFSCNLSTEACLLNLRVRVISNSNKTSIKNFGCYTSNKLINSFGSSNFFYILHLIEGVNTLKKKVLSLNELFFIGLSFIKRGALVSSLKNILRLNNSSSKIVEITPFSNSQGLSFFGVKKIISKETDIFGFGRVDNFFYLKLDDIFKNSKIKSTLTSFYLTDMVLLSNKNYNLKYNYYSSANIFEKSLQNLFFSIINSKNNVFNLNSMLVTFSLTKTIYTFCFKHNYVIHSHYNRIFSSFNESDNIFSTFSCFEEEEFYFNIEQRPQVSHYIVKNLYNSKSAIEYLSFFYGCRFKQSYSSAFLKYILEFLNNTNLFEINKQCLFKDTFNFHTNEKSFVSNYPDKSLLEDFYISNHSKNSNIMQKSSRAVRRVSSNFN